MKYVRIAIVVTLALCLQVTLLSSLGLAFDKKNRPYPHPSTYIPSISQVWKHKSFYDDPRPWMKTNGIYSHLPKEMVDKLTFDVAEMKKQWSELVGFKAPDLVGKIAPHIKPGKYTYEDVQKDPEFQKLFWPELLSRIKPGGPPFAMNMPEFEIIPTQQYYWSLPISKATRANQGKTQLDEEGYLVQGTWDSGYPFPKPSGKFKARQIMYNFEKRSPCWGWNFWQTNGAKGWTKNLREDLNMRGSTKRTRLGGRCAMEPYGFLDKIAEGKLENNATFMMFSAPRDLNGTTLYQKLYQDPDVADVMMVYLPSLRRVRKMSTSDTQDPMFGADSTYDDLDGLTQKISKTRFPYEYELIDEREFLVPTMGTDGSSYITSENLEYRGVKFERRPIYVVKLTQLDSNYVYSKRIIYIDKELFINWTLINFDQKGRLYRTAMTNYAFLPKMGMVYYCAGYHHMTDQIDTHSSSDLWYQLPALWSRDEVSMKSMVRMK